METFSELVYISQSLQRDDMQFLSPTSLLIAAAIGTLSAYIAHRRGRNPYAWFFVGFIFGVLGIMAIFFAPFGKKKGVAVPVAAKPEPVIQGPKDKFWYYLDGSNQQQGPMSHDALTAAWKEGKVNLSTLIWHEDLTDWKALKETLG